MNLNEAIEHAQDTAGKQSEAAFRLAVSEDTTREAADCFFFASEHLQLAEWLEELKALRELKNRTEAVVIINVPARPTNQDVLSALLKDEARLTVDRRGQVHIRGISESWLSEPYKESEEK